MADLRSLVVVAFALFGGAAHAGYAYPADPEGFTRGGSWGTGPGYATRSANDRAFGRVIYQPNGLRVPVPGKPVIMPVAYRLAQNAPRIAAGVLFANPALRAALGIAAWLGAAKFIWDEVEQAWRQIQPGGQGQETMLYTDPPHVMGWLPKGEICVASGSARFPPGNLSGTTYKFKSFGVSSDGNMMCIGQLLRSDGTVQDNNYRFQPQSKKVESEACPAGWTETPAGCLSPAVPQPEFVEELGGKPMPETVPGELPYPTPLPIDNPPSPWINPVPSPNPNHRPLFVPQGDPLPNPNYNPNAEPSPENQPYIRPGIHINPSPTPDDPFRLDLKPVNRPSPNDDPDPDPESEPDPGDKPKPEEQQSLCEKHPDIVACQKLGDLTPVELPGKTVPMAINREEGFGPATGACPAPKEFFIMGKPMAFRWDLLCDFANGIRPILIGFAYLSAALAFMGLTRRGD